MGVQKLNFDDDKIADEKSIENMKLRFAGMKNNLMVKSLENAKSLNSFDMISLGQGIKKADKLLSFLFDFSGDELKSFVTELKEVNLLELEKLKNEYDEMKALEEQNPELVERPNSMHMLEKEITKNEIFVLQKLFTLFAMENKDEMKKVLKQMISRRLDAVENIFL